MEECLQPQLLQAGVLENGHKKSIAVLRNEISEQISRGELIEVAIDAVEIITSTLFNG